MSRGARRAERAERIVRAIGLGVDTTKALAVEFKTPVLAISVELHRLEEMGSISCVGVVSPRRGHYFSRWRVAEAA